MSSSLGSLESSPRGGADGDTSLLCFQHRLLKAETGLPPDTSSKRRRAKVGRAFCGPKNQRIDTGCVITSDVFFGGSFYRFGAYLEGQKNASAAAGARFWRRGNGASAAAGVTF